NHVAGKRLAGRGGRAGPGVVDEDGVAGRAAEVGEVALAVQGGGDGSGRFEAGELAGLFPRDEKVRLVAADGSAEAAAVLIQLHGRAADSEEVPRVEGVILE